MSRNRTRRPHYVKRRVGVVSLLALVVAIGVYLPATLLAPVTPTAAVVLPYKAPAESKLALAFPGYGATAVEAVGFDDSLTTSGQTTPRSIASISKVVTALVVLSKRPLNGGSGPKITFTPADTALYSTYLAQDGEVAPMTTGASLTEKQVLQVALIKSANNYAGTLALWAFGSNKAYAQAATTWLRDNGLDQTTIVEPTGLNPKNTSTASDLVALGKLALANSDVASIVRTKSVTVPGAGTVVNSNKLLGLDSVVGIKTGTLDQAGACLLFATRERIGGQTVTVIGAMLGGKDHDSLDVDVQRLLASVKAGFRTVDAVARGEVYGSYATKWGETARATAATSVTRLVYGDTPVRATVSLEKVAEGDAGDRVGTLTVTIGSDTVDVPLDLDKRLEGPDTWWRVTNPAVSF